jgi:hypothetical protein
VTLDAADIEAIARRVAELIAERPGEPAARLVDAAHVAALLGVERDWVYAHADQLGAIRLGGPKGRLRFDLATVTAHADRTADVPATTSRARPRARVGRRPTTGSPNHLDSAAKKTYNKSGRAARQRPRP